MPGGQGSETLVPRSLGDTRPAGAPLGWGWEGLWVAPRKGVSSPPSCDPGSTGLYTP